MLHDASIKRKLEPEYVIGSDWNDAYFNTIEKLVNISFICSFLTQIRRQ